MRRTPTSRPGFTLIELLVAAALSLVVMTVLSLAFQTGMQTLSQLKSVVGMAEQLRAAEGVMRRDLSAYHLEADQAQTQRVSVMDGTHRKGYLSFTQGGIVQTAGGPVGRGPQQEGSGATADAPLSFRTLSTTDTVTPASALYGRAWMDHLSFTVRLAGDKPQEVFTATAVGAGGLLAKLRNIDPLALPPETQSADPTNTQLTSRWAEVSYLLVPSGPSGGTSTTVFTSDEGGVTQLPLYTLHRRQRVLADRTITSPPTGNPNAFDVTDADAARGIAFAQLGSLLAVLGPDRVASGADVPNRLGGANDPLAVTPNLSVMSGLPAAFQQDLRRRGYPIPIGKIEYGSDVLLNNVVSMTVRPVYEFDVSAAVRSQLNTVGLGNFTPVPKSFATPSYSPTDWLELLAVPTGSAGSRAPLPAPATAAFPRFYDTAGPSQVGVVFRSPSTGAALPVTWDQTPGALEVSVKLKAVEIKLRVYDSKNKTSRQMTVLQDL